MKSPEILALATGVPNGRYEQAELFTYLQTLFKRTRHARFVFNQAAIEHRHMAIDQDF